MKVLDKEENEWLTGCSRSNMIDFPFQAEVAMSANHTRRQHAALTRKMIGMAKKEIVNDEDKRRR